MNGTNKYINLLSGGGSGLPAGEEVNDLLVYNGQDWVPRQPDELSIGANMEFPFSYTMEVQVEHNLGVIPLVVVLDTNNTEIICTIHHNSYNLFTVTFNNYYSGKIIVK